MFLRRPAHIGIDDVDDEEVKEHTQLRDQIFNQGGPEACNLTKVNISEN